jgi:hypothetical protein
VEHTEEMDQPGQQPASMNDPLVYAQSPENHAGTGLSSQVAGGPCSCGGNPNGAGMITYAYVYAVGRVEPRFPRLAVEKELAQATGRA